MNSLLHKECITPAEHSKAKDALTLMFMTYSNFEKLSFSSMFSVAKECFKRHPYMMSSFNKISPKTMTQTFNGEATDTD